jgi:hypothetical protein
MNSIDTNGGFNLPNKIDDSRDMEPNNDVEPEPEDEQFDFSRHDNHPYMMYPPPPPHFQFSPSNEKNQSSSFLSDGDNKIYFIVLFVAFILGFFMGKTMQPIIIKST